MDFNQPCNFVLGSRSTCCCRFPSSSVHSLVSIQLVHGFSYCELGIQLSQGYSVSYFLSTNFPTPKVLWFSPLIFLLGLCLYKLLSWELWQGFMRDCSKMLVFSPVSLLERASFPILSWVLFWKGAQVYLKFVLKSLPQYHLVQNFALNQSCPIQHNP